MGVTDTSGPAPRSLLVTKNRRYPAGHQGPVSISVVCNGVALSPDFVIPARPSVDETADGATATVRATVSGDGQRATVQAGEVVPVNVTDVYDGAPGILKVTKAIPEPAAHRRGRIGIVVAFGGPLHTFAFVIPAGIRVRSVF